MTRYIRNISIEFKSIMLHAHTQFLLINLQEKFYDVVMTILHIH